MKFVEIYKLKNNGEQNMILVCRLTGKVVKCEGDKNFAENLAKEGVRDYSNASGKKLFPTDGIIFLENLKLAFKSGYLMATDVQKSEE